MQILLRVFIALWVAAISSAALAKTCNIPRACLSLKYDKLSQKCDGESRRRYNAAAVPKKACPDSFTLSYSDYEGVESVHVTPDGQQFNTCGPAKIIAIKGECAPTKNKNGKLSGIELPGGALIGRVINFSYEDCQTFDYKSNIQAAPNCSTVSQKWKITSDMLNKQYLSSKDNCTFTNTYAATNSNLTFRYQMRCADGTKGEKSYTFSFSENGSCRFKPYDFMTGWKKWQNNPRRSLR